MLLERVGYEHLLKRSEAQLVNRDDAGDLWRLSLPGNNEALQVVEVENATIESDGSRHRVGCINSISCCDGFVFVDESAEQVLSADRRG